MTSRPEQFRLDAMRCRIAALLAKDQKLKETYVDLARGWHELAGQVEHFEQAWPDQNSQRCAPLGSACNRLK